MERTEQHSEGRAEVHVLVTEERPDERREDIWRAVVFEMPHLVAEAESREEVLASIQRILNRSVRHAEVVTMSVPEHIEVGGPLAASGYRHYGIFAGEPEALKLFDEIEEERNKHFIEPSQS